MSRKKSLQITIPTPCTQGWDSMTKTDKGRYCQACNKTVIDFSKLTDDEILQVISKSSGGLCGRFNASQLNRNITPLHTQPRFPLISPMAMAGALLAGFFTTSAAAKLPEKPAQEWQEKGENVPEISGDTIKFIRGKVVDSTTLNPVAFCEIYIKGTTIGTIADTSGEFLLKIPSELLGLDFTINFTGVNYEKKSIFFSAKANQDRFYIELIRTENEVVIIEYFGGIKEITVPKKTIETDGIFWKRFKNWLKK